MEINMENAFYYAIRGSLGPVVSSLDAVANTMQYKIQRQVHKVLEKPLLSTFVIACAMILPIIGLTISILVVVGVLCIVVIILIVEGFVLGMIISLAATITALVLAIIIIAIGLISSCKVK